MTESNIAPYKTVDELTIHAEGLLKNQCEILRKTVDHCLTNPYASLPGLMYCFSTIDLFGALAGGQAAKDRPTTKQTMMYMERFMNYPVPIPELLLGLFRHKLVHLAHPNPVLQYFEGKIERRVAGNYTHNTPNNHLKLDTVSSGNVSIDDGLWKITYTQELWLDIPSFTNDIVDSALSSNGYFEQLTTDTSLRENYAAALNGLYDPTK